MQVEKNSIGNYLCKYDIKQKISEKIGNSWISYGINVKNIGYGGSGFTQDYIKRKSSSQNYHFGQNYFPYDAQNICCLNYLGLHIGMRY